MTILFRIEIQEIEEIEISIGVTGQPGAAIGMKKLLSSIDSEVATESDRVFFRYLNALADRE